MQIDAKHYGFKDSHYVMLYKKQGEWRIYEQSTYHERDVDEQLIQEVMQEKRVKRCDVKIGRVKSLSIEVVDPVDLVMLSWLGKSKG